MRNTVVCSFNYKLVVLFSMFHQGKKCRLCDNFIFHTTDLANMQVMLKIVGLFNSMTSILVQLYAST